MTRGGYQGADRRQGQKHLTPLQFWLGITGSIVTLLFVAGKVGQWTGRVDLSVQQLTTTVQEFKASADRDREEHVAIRLKTQSNSDAIEMLKEGRYERTRPVPAFSPKGTSVQ